MSLKNSVFDSFSLERRVIGPFRFRVYKDLLSGEAELIEAEGRRAAELGYLTESLVRKVCRDEGVDENDRDGVTRIREQLFTSEHQDERLITRYSEDLTLMLAQSPNTETLGIQLATLFLQSRAEARPSPEGEWAPLHDPLGSGEEWTEADTRRLPGQLRKEIGQFIAAEREAGSAKGKPAAKTRRAAGKNLPA